MRCPPARAGSRPDSALTSFVGREQEVAEVKRLLGATRLLTLSGAGGAGKTRLALEAATQMLDDYPGGVWLVEFTHLPRHQPRAAECPRRGDLAHAAHGARRGHPLVRCARRARPGGV